MTVKDLLATYDGNISRRIVLKGVKVTDSINGNDREGKIEQNGSSVAVYAQLKTLLLTAGSEGDIIVYPAVNNSTKRLSFWADEDFTPTVVGTVINVKNLTVEQNKTAPAGATTNSPAPISYTIAEDGIVSVDQDGTIHGLLVGETTVKASVEAVEGYSAAEASFKVTVTEPAPGNLTVDIESSVIPTSYADDAVVAVDGLDFYFNQTACYNEGVIQMKKQVSYVANKTAFGKPIVRVTILGGGAAGTFYATNYKCCGGTSEKPENEISATEIENGLVYDFTGKGYTFFQLSNTSNYAAKLVKISVEYEK